MIEFFMKAKLINARITNLKIQLSTEDQAGNLFIDLIYPYLDPRVRYE